MHAGNYATDTAQSMGLARVQILRQCVTNSNGRHMPARSPKQQSKAAKADHKRMFDLAASKPLPPDEAAVPPAPPSPPEPAPPPPSVRKPQLQDVEPGQIPAKRARLVEPPPAPPGPPPSPPAVQLSGSMLPFSVLARAATQHSGTLAQPGMAARQHEQPSLPPKHPAFAPEAPPPPPLDADQLMDLLQRTRGSQPMPPRLSAPAMQPQWLQAQLPAAPRPPPGPPPLSAPQPPPGPPLQVVPEARNHSRPPQPPLLPGPPSIPPPRPPSAPPPPAAQLPRHQALPGGFPPLPDPLRPLVRATDPVPTSAPRQPPRSQPAAAAPSAAPIRQPKKRLGKKRGRPAGQQSPPPPPAVPLAPRLGLPTDIADDDIDALYTILQFPGPPPKEPAKATAQPLHSAAATALASDAMASARQLAGQHAAPAKRRSRWDKGRPEAASQETLSLQDQLSMADIYGAGADVPQDAHTRPASVPPGPSPPAALPEVSATLQAQTAASILSKGPPAALANVAGSPAENQPASVPSTRVPASLSLAQNGVPSAAPASIPSRLGRDPVRQQAAAQQADPGLALAQLSSAPQQPVQREAPLNPQARSPSPPLFPPGSHLQSETAPQQPVEPLQQPVGSHQPPAAPRSRSSSPLLDPRLMPTRLPSRPTTPQPELLAAARQPQQLRTRPHSQVCWQHGLCAKLPECTPLTALGAHHACMHALAVTVYCTSPAVLPDEVLMGFPALGMQTSHVWQESILQQIRGDPASVPVHPAVLDLLRCALPLFACALRQLMHADLALMVICSAWPMLSMCQSQTSASPRALHNALPFPARPPMLSIPKFQVLPGMHMGGCFFCRLLQHVDQHHEHKQVDSLQAEEAVPGTGPGSHSHQLCPLPRGRRAYACCAARALNSRGKSTPCLLHPCTSCSLMLT